MKTIQLLLSESESINVNGLIAELNYFEDTMPSHDAAEDDNTIHLWYMAWPRFIASENGGIFSCGEYAPMVEYLKDQLLESDEFYDPTLASRLTCSEEGVLA